MALTLGMGWDKVERHGLHLAASALRREKQYLMCTTDNLSLLVYTSASLR